MNASNNLPVSKAATPPTASSANKASSSPASGDLAADTSPHDFVEMLAGMLKDDPAVSTIVNQPAAKASTDKELSTTDAQTTGAVDASMLIPLVVALPVDVKVAPQVTPKISATLSDIQELLGEVAKTKSSLPDAQLLDRLMEALDVKKDATGSVPASSSSFAMPTPANSLSVAIVSADAGAQSVVQRHLHAQVGTPAWSSELGTDLTWMAAKGHQAASLRLSPEHLGPLEVRIDMHEDQATVWFGATHADTRAALEQALPRLRELFASQGLSLTDAGVFREPPRDQSRTQSGNGSFNSGGDDAFGGEGVTSARIGLVDAYA